MRCVCVGGICVTAAALLSPVTVQRTSASSRRRACSAWADCACISSNTEVRFGNQAPLPPPPPIVDPLLPQGYGLTAPGEAAGFVRCLHALQLFCDGRVPLDAVPPDCTLRHSAPAAGVTRWVFGSLGAQPAPLAQGLAPGGSPDLARAPLVTRFTDCMSVGIQVPPAGGAARTIVGACDAPPPEQGTLPALRDAVTVQVRRCGGGGEGRHERRNVASV